MRIDSQGCPVSTSAPWTMHTHIYTKRKKETGGRGIKGGSQRGGRSAGETTVKQNTMASREISSQAAEGWDKAMKHNPPSYKDGCKLGTSHLGTREGQGSKSLPPHGVLVIFMETTHPDSLRNVPMAANRHLRTKEDDH